jgi:succinate-semialdehyde dehydrogenase/glutarate-semialdehyde dehydrogenase
MVFINNKKLVNYSMKLKINYDTQKIIDSKINLINKNLFKIKTVRSRINNLLVLKKFLQKHKQNLINLIANEANKTFNESKSEFDYAIEFVDYSLNLLSKYKFIKNISNNRKIFLKSIGLVFAMTPYNDPLAGIIRKIAPSLSAGSPIILKPSPYCANLSQYLSSNLPKDLKKIIQITVIKENKFTTRIIKNKKIKLVTFTGSTKTGLKLNNIKISHTQKKILELGGINYAIIFDDKNLESIIDEVLIRKIKAAGQACSSINKLYVHKQIKYKFEKIIHSKVSRIFCGNVFTKHQPHFGPVISKKHCSFLKKLEYKSLKTDYLLAKSKNKNDTKNLFPLTLIKTDFNDKVFDKFETFGPLLGVSYFENENTVLKKVSENEYSLVCYIFTKSPKIINIAKNLNFGSLGINTTKIQSPSAPTGGNNLSGLGREGGEWGLNEFLTTVNYVINK